MDLLAILFILIAATATGIKLRAAFLTAKIAQVSTSCTKAWGLLAYAIALAAARDILFMFHNSPFHDITQWVYYILALAIGILFFKSVKGLHSCYTNEINVLTSIAEEMTNKVMILNKNGKGLFFNFIWSTQTGLDKAHSIGEGWKTAIDSKDLFQFNNSFLVAQQQGITLEQRVRLINSAGESEWHFVKATPVRDSDCTIEYWFVVITNINKYVLTKEELYGRS